MSELGDFTEAQLYEELVRRRVADDVHRRGGRYLGLILSAAYAYVGWRDVAEDYRNLDCDAVTEAIDAVEAFVETSEETR